MKKILILTLFLWSCYGYTVNRIKDNLRAAESSALFQQKFNSNQIQAKGLSQITLNNGVKLEFKKYTELTRLDKNVKFKPLMSQPIVRQYLQRMPRYTENILQLKDRLIIDRTMNVSMKKGVCKRAQLPDSVKELCFMSKQGVIPGETKNYLRDFRNKLARSKANQVVKNGLMVKQLRQMNDDQLLEVLLNSDDRKIKLVSVLPTKVYKKKMKQNLWNVNKQFVNSTATSASQYQGLKASYTQFQYVGKPDNKKQSRNKVFAKKYFLTGFTIGREMTDTFEIQIAKSTFLTDRYYLEFSYVIRAGFGLRFPFSVSVSSKALNNRVQGEATVGEQAQVNSRPTRGRGRATRFNKAKLNRGSLVLAGKHSGKSSNTFNKVSYAEVSMSVAPVDVDSKGRPAYQAVGLPQNKYFKGKEFVLELYATCHFKASIPGKDINKDCPVVDQSRSQDINPIIGNEKRNLATLWINGSATGLGVNVWAGSVTVDLGIEANLTNGRIGFNAFGFNDNLINNKQTQALLFRDRNIKKFKVKNKKNKNALFQINSPSYGFDFELLPVVRAKLKLDLGIKSFNKTLGPYSIDALSLSVGLNLNHHQGTVKSHLYTL